MDEVFLPTIIDNIMNQIDPASIVNKRQKALIH